MKTRGGTDAASAWGPCHGEAPPPIPQAAERRRPSGVCAGVQCLSAPLDAAHVVESTGDMDRREGEDIGELTDEMAREERVTAWPRREDASLGKLPTPPSLQAPSPSLAGELGPARLQETAKLRHADLGRWYDRELQPGDGQRALHPFVHGLRRWRVLATEAFSLTHGLRGGGEEGEGLRGFQHARR